MKDKFRHLTTKQLRRLFSNAYTQMELKVYFFEVAVELSRRDKREYTRIFVNSRYGRMSPNIKGRRFIDGKWRWVNAN